MARWIDNADSYICSACGHEVNNPNKQPCGAGKCYNCGAKMGTKDKPRLAEVLGIETGEHIEVKGYVGEFWVDPDGLPMAIEGSSSWVAAILEAINHPESIIRTKRLTEAELERCRVYGAKWVSRDNYMARFELWRTKPEYKNGIYYSQANKGGLIAAIFDDSLFQSVRPGDCIEVEEAGGDGR